MSFASFDIVFTKMDRHSISTATNVCFLGLLFLGLIVVGFDCCVLFSQESMKVSYEGERFAAEGAVDPVEQPFFSGACEL